MEEFLRKLLDNIFDGKVTSLSEFDKNILLLNKEFFSEIYLKHIADGITLLLSDSYIEPNKQMLASLKLGAFLEDSRVFNFILQLTNFSVETLDEYLGDFFATESLSHLLAATANNDWQKLLSVIKKPDLDKYVKGACFNALVILAVTGKIDRSEIVKYLKNIFNEILTEKIAINDDLVFYVFAAMDIYPEELIEEIKELFGLFQIPSHEITIENVLDILKNDKESFLKSEKSKYLNYNFFEDVLEQFDEKKIKSFQKIYNEIIKNKPKKNNSIISRNDKCFCGSGIKYKKCCLNKSQSYQQIIFESCEITYEALVDSIFESLSSEDKETITKLYNMIYEDPFMVINESTKLMKKHPNIPSLYNYKYLAYLHVKENFEALRLLKESINKFPDYLFAKIEMAKYFIRRGEPERISEVFGDKKTLSQLYPDRKTFHVSEWVSFSYVMGLLALSRNVTFLSFLEMSLSNLKRGTF